MGLKLFVMKYAKQIQAMSPKYDVIYEVKKDDPIAFEDSENVKLSMAIIADTHLPNRESAELNLKNTFTDIENSKEKFDAFLIAGDIADYGTGNEYERFFRVLDNQK
ncbi:MAG: metallophosphoesterase, partial [Clostridia bacterium]|nr:metallophosphoesterase [Clostridia bacterium]